MNMKNIYLGLLLSLSCILNSGCVAAAVGAGVGYLVSKKNHTTVNTTYNETKEVPAGSVVKPKEVYK